MSESNVELVREGLEAYNAGDAERIIAFADPEIEFVPLGSLLEGGSYHGHDGIRRFFAEIGEVWDDRQIELDELRDAGDCVVVLGHFHARGRASGVDVRYPSAWSCEVRDGKITAIRASTDQAAALKAAGLDA
jgi:ketosteroid isomerase-like protein